MSSFPEQLFQARPGSHFYADERKPYAERAVKARCLYKYDAEKNAERNKVMKINEQWEKSHANIQSERGILKWQIRSIQTEGHFGDIKGNENFCRFNYRSTDKVYKEFMLYTIRRNLNKYCRFLNEKLKKFEGKTTEKTA